MRKCLHSVVCYFAELLRARAIFKHALRLADSTGLVTPMRCCDSLRHPPPKAPSHGDLHLHLMHGSLGPPESPPKRHLDRPSRFCRAHERYTNRPIDHATPCIAIGSYLYLSLSCGLKQIKLTHKTYYSEDGSSNCFFSLFLNKYLEGVFNKSIDNAFRNLLPLYLIDLFTLDLTV